MPGAGRPVTFRSARTQIWKTFGDELRNDIMEQVYRAYNKETEALIASTKDQVTLVWIWSGKHRAFSSYSDLLDNTVPDVCPTCQEGLHTLEHWWLRCLGTLATKREIFGGGEEQGLMLLTKEPLRALALARRTLLGRPLRAPSKQQQPFR